MFAFPGEITHYPRCQYQAFDGHAEGARHIAAAEGLCAAQEAFL